MLQEIKVTKVVDGDTVHAIKKSDGTTKLKIRVQGIDAPETKQEYGPESTAALSALLFPNKRIYVMVDATHDKYGRTLGKLFAEDNTANGKKMIDVQLEMIRGGHAWMYRRFEKNSEYERAEEEARAEGRGLWGASSEPEAPWDWRKKHKRHRWSKKERKRQKYRSISTEIVDPGTTTIAPQSLPQTISIEKKCTLEQCKLANRIRDFEPLGKVLGGRIMVGSKLHANNIDTLKQHGITHIMSTIGPPECQIKGFIYHWISLHDDERQHLVGQVVLAEKWMREQLDTYPDARILVHCKAGISRSTSLVIAYLILEHGYTYDDALEAIRKERDIVNPNASFEEQLRSMQAVQRRTLEILAHRTKPVERAYDSYTLPVSLHSPLAFPTPSLPLLTIKKAEKRICSY